MRSARRDTITIALAGSVVLACLAGCSPTDIFTPIGIAGDATEPLRPGRSVPLDLEITNRRAVPVDVAELRVEISGISAPFASSLHPCTPEDFTITQSHPSIAIAVAALSSRRLSASTLPESEWPQVQMLNRPVNQDGCRDATLTLRYSARAVGVSG